MMPSVRPVETKPEPKPEPKPVVAPKLPPTPPKPLPKNAPAPLPPIPQARPVQAPPQQPAQQAIPQAAAAAAGTGHTPGPPVVAGGGKGLSPEDEQGRTNCLAKNMEKMGEKERQACETHVFVFLDHQKADATSPPIDPAKRAEYDAALARKHYKSAPISGLDNGAQTGASCKQANIGMGCLGDMEIPVGKATY